MFTLIEGSKVAARAFAKEIKAMGGFTQSGKVRKVLENGAELYTSTGNTGKTQEIIMNFRKGETNLSDVFQYNDGKIKHTLSNATSDSGSLFIWPRLRRLFGFNLKPKKADVIADAKAFGVDKYECRAVIDSDKMLSGYARKVIDESGHLSSEKKLIDGSFFEKVIKSILGGEKGAAPYLG